MKQILFLILSRVVYYLNGTKLSRIPFVMRLYKFLYYALLPEDRCVEIKLKKYSLLVNIGDMGGITTSLITRGLYHPQMTCLMEKLLKPAMTFVNVGANIGYFTVMAASLVGKTGKIIAIEPEAYNYSLLKRNIEINKLHNISFPINKAVSNYVGKGKLYLDRINCGSHSMLSPSKYVNSFSQDIMEVEVDKLDNIVVGTVDLVKIDVEGSEMEVLEGMDKIIVSNPNIILIFEFLPQGLERAGHKASEFIDKLFGYGFYLYNIDEDNKCVNEVSKTELIRRYTGEGWTNILATRRKDVSSRWT